MSISLNTILVESNSKRPNLGFNSEYKSDRSIIREWLLIIFGMIFIEPENLCILTMN